ncbi:MAG: HupE/UreJ family protein [Verrucomicrobiota bacterium]
MRHLLHAGWLGLWLWWAAALPVLAHITSLPMATATIQPDGKYALDLTFDVLAFALDDFPENVNDLAMNELLDGPAATLDARLARAQVRFKNEFAVLENGKSGTVETLVFPTVADIQRHAEASPLLRLPVMLVLSLDGRLPQGARSVAFRLPAKLGMVSLTVVRPEQPIGVWVVNPGEVTAPMPVMLDAMASASAADGPPLPAIAEPSRWEWARRYVVLGYVHILPRGLDHILFVLGLFLLGNRLRPLLMQVTAFTLAHSITLALSMYGIIQLPPQVVEPLIALSIALVAMENLFTAKLHRWRLFVVFGFGLIHGLGFASVLTALGLPRHEFATALVSFNLGVEGGQLSVIGLALLAVGCWRQRWWYRRAIVLPASGAIAAVGLFWAIQRVWLYSR